MSTLKRLQGILNNTTVSKQKKNKTVTFKDPVPEPRVKYNRLTATTKEFRSSSKGAYKSSHRQTFTQCTTTQWTNHTVEVRTGNSKTIQTGRQNAESNSHGRVGAGGAGQQSKVCSRVCKWDFWWGLGKIDEKQAINHSPKVNRGVVSLLCKQVRTISPRCWRPYSRHQHHFLYPQASGACWQMEGHHVCDFGVKYECDASH